MSKCSHIASDCNRNKCPLICSVGVLQDLDGRTELGAVVLTVLGTIAGMPFEMCPKRQSDGLRGCWVHGRTGEAGWIGSLA